MKRVFSAGGIVYKKGGEDLKFLLVKNQSMKNPETDYWGFPKGHVESGETIKEGALREVEEETSIKANIIEKIGDIKYIFTNPATNEKFLKTVTYYLMEYFSGDAKGHNWEVSEAEFFSAEEVLNKLSFDKDKAIFEKALQVLKR